MKPATVLLALSILTICLGMPLIAGGILALAALIAALYKTKH